MHTVVSLGKYGSKVMISSRTLIKESGKRTYRRTKSKNKQVLTGPGLTMPFVKMKTSHFGSPRQLGESEAVSAVFICMFD